MTIAQAMTEDELLTAIIEAATFLGWLVHHDRRSDLARQQGHAGFPDLVLAKRGHAPLFIECKADNGRLTEGQFAWRLALVEGQWDYRLVYPHDLDALLRFLAR